MFIQLLRLSDNGTSTIGTIHVNGTFKCFTLEDTFNEPKIYGKTRIPAGEYEIKLRNEGSMTKKYATKYPEHEGMLWLQDVPGFEHIYIHVGNTSDHTDGCILIGKTCNSNNFTISSSVIAYRELYSDIIAAMKRNEQITIQII